MTIFLRSFLTFWIATVVIISISFGLVLMTHHFNRVPPVSVPLPDLQACLQTAIQARSAGRFHAGGESMPAGVHPGPIQDRTAGHLQVPQPPALWPRKSRQAIL